MAVFDEEWKEQTPILWYLAQISYRLFELQWTVANLLNKDAKPTDMQIKDFILKFLSENEVLEAEKPRVETPDQRKARIAYSKSAWMTWAGLDKEGKPLPGREVKPAKVQLPPAVLKRTREFLASQKQSSN